MRRLRWLIVGLAVAAAASFAAYVVVKAHSAPNPRVAIIEASALISS